MERCTHSLAGETCPADASSTPFNSVMVGTVLGQIGSLPNQCALPFWGEQREDNILPELTIHGSGQGSCCWMDQRLAGSTHATTQSRSFRMPGTTFCVLSYKWRAKPCNPAFGRPSWFSSFLPFPSSPGRSLESPGSSKVCENIGLIDFRTSHLASSRWSD